MIIIGFGEYIEGEDPLGDLIATHAAKKCPKERYEFPYNHCFLLVGDTVHGFHRTELWTSGTGYAWYPPSEFVFPPGVYFKLEDPKRELKAIYRLFDPWVRECAKVDIRMLVQLFRGETVVWPTFERDRGSFTCTTFVLWLLDFLGVLPHRTPELITMMREYPDIFEEIAGDESAKGSIRWLNGRT